MMGDVTSRGGAWQVVLVLTSGGVSNPHSHPHHSPRYGFVYYSFTDLALKWR